MAYYGCITGTVKYHGAGIEDAWVTLYRVDGEWDTYATQTWWGGGYQECGIDPGQYLVSFSVFPSATTWYKDANSSAPSTARATRITISSNSTITNVNGYLGDLGACISGKFIDVGGQPGSWASYWLFDEGNITPIGFWNGWYGSEWDLVGWADGDGGFVACGLSPGSYRIEAGSWQEGKGVAFGGVGPVVVGAGEHKDIGVVPLSVSTIYLPIIRK